MADPNTANSDAPNDNRDSDSEDGVEIPEVFYKRIHRELNLNTTTIVDYSEAIMDFDSNEEEDEDEEVGEDEVNKPDDAVEADAFSQDEVGAVIQTIEAKYLGKSVTELGYEEDSLVDEEEIFAEKMADNEETEIGGFFVNVGELKTKKRARTDKDEDSIPAPKRRKTEETGPIDLAPELEAAIKVFEEAFRAKGYHNAKFFPREMEPQLVSIASLAMKLHPHGFITADVVRRLTRFVNLTESTLKQKLNRLKKREIPAQGPSELQQAEAKRTEGLAKLKALIALQIHTFHSQPKDSVVVVNPDGSLAEPKFPNWRWTEQVKELLLELHTNEQKLVELKNDTIKKSNEEAKDKDKADLLKERTEISKLNTEIVALFPGKWMNTAKISGVLSGIRKKDKAKNQPAEASNDATPTAEPKTKDLAASSASTQPPAKPPKKKAPKPEEKPKPKPQDPAPHAAAPQAAAPAVKSSRQHPALTLNSNPQPKQPTEPTEPTVQPQPLAVVELGDETQAF